MANLILVLARFVSALGSVLTAATIPLYLAESGHESLIPFALIGMAAGRIVSSQVLLPRVLHWPGPRVLKVTSLSGAALLFGTSLAFAYAGAPLPILAFLFPVLSFSTAIIGTLDDAVAHSALGAAQAGSRWVHLDSTAFTICRVISPGLAALILAATHNRPSAAFAIDGLTYLVASVVFLRLLGTSAVVAPAVSPRRESFFETLTRRPRTWATLAFVALGASAYNAGAVIQIKKLGFDLEGISIFIMVQNAAMVLAGFALAKWPELSRWRQIGILSAGIGLLGLSQANSLTGASLATALMSVGMVLVLQGMRGEIASSRESTAAKRTELGALATINSGMGILGALLCSALSQWGVSWSLLLLAGGLVITAGAWAAGAAARQSDPGMARM